MKAKPPRNPMVAIVRDPKYRKRIAKSGLDRADQKDPWSKKTKHKGKEKLDEFYQVGDKVDIVSRPLKNILLRSDVIKKQKDEEKKKVKKKEAVVQEPLGPDNTVGVMVDGEYHLVNQDDLELIYEAFLDLSEWSYADMNSGINVVISNEEKEILNRCSDRMYKNQMDDREKEVARRMVSRGILHRYKDDEGLFFTGDKPNDIRRT